MDLIERLISDFFHTTGLSTQFFDAKFQESQQLGPCCIVVTPRLRDDLEGLSKATVLRYGQYHFLAFPFTAPPHPKGYFLSGPFQTGGEIQHLPHKPEHVLPYLQDLFGLIQNKRLSEAPGYGTHIQKALAYLKANYQDPIALDDICDHLNLNKNYFCGLFKSSTGLTFNQYLNRLRIEESKKLLKASKGSIIDVSLSVGFNNHTHFSLTFKKLVGMTPTEFRNQPCPVLSEWRMDKKELAK